MKIVQWALEQNSKTHEFTHKMILCFGHKNTRYIKFNWWEDISSRKWTFKHQKTNMGKQTNAHLKGQILLVILFQLCKLGAIHLKHTVKVFAYHKGIISPKSLLHFSPMIFYVWAKCYTWCSNKKSEQQSQIRFSHINIIKIQIG